MKHLKRYKVSKDKFKTTPSEQGLLFCHPNKGKVLDLTDSGFQVVGMCVDTLRQIFKGRMDLDFLTDIQHSIDLNEKKLRLLGFDWLVGKSSKSSGYQYRLQNNDLGLILFFKMFHAKAESESSLLKIECSPWYLDNRMPEQVDDFLRTIAEKILRVPEPHYPAIHLAVDIQGWEPEHDLADKVACRSRRVAQYNGFENIEFNFYYISCVYDRCQSFKFGPATSVQLAIYDKTIQSRDSDKLDYIQNKWEKYTSKQGRAYDSDRDVFRVELRSHHSVVEQFALGSYDNNGVIGLSLKSYTDITSHLHGLWQNGLKSFKLKHNTNYFHPIWSILMNDLVFAPEGISNQSQQLNYQRHYKKPDTFSGKNYQLYLGNFLSACARKRLSFEQVLEELQNNIIWNDIALYYENINTTEHELIERLREGYQERILLGYAI